MGKCVLIGCKKNMWGGWRYCRRHAAAKQAQDATNLAKEPQTPAVATPSTPINNNIETFVKDFICDCTDQECSSRKRATQSIKQLIEKETLEARRSERAWAHKNMRDHGADPKWVEVGTTDYLT